MSVRAASYNLEMYHAGKNKTVCFAVSFSSCCITLTAKQTALFLYVWYISKLYDAVRTDIDSKTNSFILHTTWKCTTQVRIKLFALLSVSVRAASYNLEMYHAGKNKVVCFAVNVSRD
jgi:hypothetical protein